MSLEIDIIRKRMIDANISQAQLAGLSGVLANHLSAFMTGTRHLRNPEILRIYKTLDALDRLIMLAKPFAVPRDMAEIKELLRRANEGDLAAPVSPPSTQQQPQPQSQRLPTPIAPPTQEPHGRY